MFYGLAQEAIPHFQEALRAVLATYPRHFAQDMLVTFDRNMGFYEDTAFMQAFKGEAGKDQESSLLWRLHVLAWAADHCRHLEGDFVECGVFEGFSTAVLARYLDFARLAKRWASIWTARRAFSCCGCSTSSAWMAQRRTTMFRMVSRAISGGRWRMLWSGWSALARKPNRRWSRETMCGGHERSQ